MASLRILLVEDNYLNQKLILINLNKLGFAIDIANNGKEALDKVNTNSYDLVIMDLMMPIMDGLEATRIIRNNETGTLNHLPIIGLTANTFDADREKCLSTGMDEYMAKPFDLLLFQSLIDKLQIQ